MQSAKSKQMTNTCNYFSVEKTSPDFLDPGFKNMEKMCAGFITLHAAMPGWPYFGWSHSMVKRAQDLCSRNNQKLAASRSVTDSQYRLLQSRAHPFTIAVAKQALASSHKLWISHALIVEPNNAFQFRLLQMD